MSRVHSVPAVRTAERTRRRRTATATAAFGYLAAYGAGVLGLLAIFLPTGRAALDLLVAALVLAAVTAFLMLIDRQPPPREAPRLRVLA